MTQIFDDEGRVYPATILNVSPNIVTQVKAINSDGYEAIQVGANKRKEKNISKAVLGHLKGKGPFQTIKEFRGKMKEAPKVGDTIDVSIFQEGERVKVSAISKGKGFQGVIKRYNFKGGPRSHGQKHTERAPGSIGAKGIARVFKGRKMPGRMGGERISVSNLRVLKVDKEAGKILVKGAIPGRRGTIVEVRGV